MIVDKKELVILVFKIGEETLTLLDLLKGKTFLSSGDTALKRRESIKACLPYIVNNISDHVIMEDFEGIEVYTFSEFIHYLNNDLINTSEVLITHIFIERDEN